MTTGTGFASSVYASPGDTLMFMITLQVNNGQIDNLMVRDTLSSRLSYADDLVVSGSSSNYSGNILSGINLYNVSQGSTVTVTYRANVASQESFSYGTSTETSSTYVSGNNLQSAPSQTSSVMVTRTAVYGVTSISTGLTNNFLTDSFLLPLLVALAGIWMFKAGMFNNLEAWLSSKRKQNRDRKAERELLARVEQIRKTEGV